MTVKLTFNSKKAFSYGQMTRLVLVENTNYLTIVKGMVASSSNPRENCTFSLDYCYFVQVLVTIAGTSRL
ncbi:MAG: hypothetical protein ACXAEU_06690 [Candidatus Hodarchaeales archaeon]